MPRFLLFFVLLYFGWIDIGRAEPVRLSQDLPPGAEVARGFRISSDERLVVFSTVDAEGNVRLFRVPVDASGPPVRIDGEDLPTTSNGYFLLDPTDRTVVYFLRGDDLRTRLRTVPLAGPASEARSLFPGEPPPSVAHVQFTSDGENLVAYMNVEEYPTSRYSLYSVPSEGAGPDRENLRTLYDGDAFEPRLDPSARHVLFRADALGSGVSELFGVPVEGPEESRFRVSEPLEAGARVHLTEFSNDGEFLVWGIQDADGVLSFYSAPWGPAGPGPLTVRPSPFANAGYVRHPSLADDLLFVDGTLVVQVAEVGPTTSWALYSAEIDDPSSPLRQISPKRSEPVENLEIAPGGRLLYRAGQALFSTPAGGTPLDEALLVESVEDGWGYAPSPDGRDLVYVAVDTSELYRMPITGPASAARRLEATWASLDVTITPDGTRAIVFGQNPGGRRGYYALCLLDPTAVPEPLDEPAVPGGEAEHPVFFPLEANVLDDGSLVFYGDLRVDGQRELFVATPTTPCTALVFADGFESGDLGAWSFGRP